MVSMKVVPADEFSKTHHHDDGISSNLTVNLQHGQACTVSSSRPPVDGCHYRPTATATNITTGQEADEQDSAPNPSLSLQNLYLNFKNASFNRFKCTFELI